MKYTANKAIKEAYKNYLASNLYNLQDCYDKLSIYKEQAYAYCVDLAVKHHFHKVTETLKIIGYNTCTFSVGFIGFIDNRKAFFYITKDYDRYCFIEDLER